MNNTTGMGQNTSPVQEAPQAEAMPAMDAPQAPHKSGSAGPIAGAVIITLILIAGGLYFWNSLSITPEQADSLSSEAALSSDTDADLAEADSEINALEAELETDLAELETSGF